MKTGLLGFPNFGFLVNWMTADWWQPKACLQPAGMGMPEAARSSSMPPVAPACHARTAAWGEEAPLIGVIRVGD